MKEHAIIDNNHTANNEVVININNLGLQTEIINIRCINYVFYFYYFVNKSTIISYYISFFLNSLEGY